MEGEAGGEAGEGGEEADQGQGQVPWPQGVAAHQDQAPQEEQVSAHQACRSHKVTRERKQGGGVQSSIDTHYFFL